MTAEFLMTIDKAPHCPACLVSERSQTAQFCKAFDCPLKAAKRAAENEQKHEEVTWMYGLMCPMSD